MSTEVLEAVGDQPGGMVAQSMMECVTPEERLLLKFYRQLSEPDRLFMQRAIEAMVIAGRPG